MSKSEYGDYRDWKGWNRRSFGIYSKAQSVYFSEELRRSGIESVDGKTILEIGFGNGDFAGWARDGGANYHGTELIEELVAQGANAGFDTHDAWKPMDMLLGGQLVDLIIAFDVLEHLDIAAIKSFLLDAADLLRPGGIVLARVPSGDSPFGRAVFHGDITHRSALGSSAVRQLASQTGFEVIDIGPPRLPILGLGPVRAIRRAGIRLAQTIIARFINLAFHEGQPRVITANLVFVLKKPVEAKR